MSKSQGVWGKIDKAALEALLFGGAILGGGGGGWIEEGRRIGHLALSSGFSEIRPLNALPEKALLLTVSAVGAPSAGSNILQPADYTRAVELFIEKTGVNLRGLISSEVGALGVVNGWLQSAALGIPVIDAPCDGRAHPLGLMGGMGLHKIKNFISRQAAVGGRVEMETRVEDFYSGPFEEVSALVRRAAIKAGGMVVVARNPVPASYVRENGAPGALAFTKQLGELYLALQNDEPEDCVKRINFFLGGRHFFKSFIREKRLEMKGGLDEGAITLEGGGWKAEVCFWNEYMTLDVGERRVATFPDLIMIFDAETCRPLLSTEVKERWDIFLIAVPSRNLILGAGVKDSALLARIEKAVGKKI